MKKLIRIISGLLTAIMLVGAISVLPIIEVSATSGSSDKETIEDKLKTYLTTVYATPEEKLATMTLKLEKDGYQLWGDEMSGEVACVDLASGQILFSNPYDVATTQGSASTKEQIMSQIFVRYVDNGTDKTFYSFVEAGYRGQIKFKNIKGGIRVEYTIGREETRMLVPRHIRKDRFEEKILKVVEEQLGPDDFTFKKLKAYYIDKFPENQKTDRQLTELYNAFPITKKMPIYVFDPTASETEIRRIEEIIKTYCPLYTYEELDKDHEETEYVGSDRAPALFKMALEYTLDQYGMSVRLPANGIRFDESEYELTYISILPYMGAGANYAGANKTKTQTGYTFYPDGSGSIFRFEKLADKGTTTISGKVYGPDFAYQNITGAHQETIRYPAFGLVANDWTTTLEKVENENGTSELVETEREVGRGYVAVIEEGDALAELYTYHAGALSKYNTMQMMFYPRPKDSYNMKDAISVGTNSTVTVVSERKYVGNYKIRYFMLTDDKIAEEKAIDKYYETSWLGMAVAYREYLDAKGQLERLTADDIQKDIPLYIETFGAVDTIERILSIPVNTKAALTSFSDIMAMYDELGTEGITNINFKLTGYANGGMISTVPYKLKWEKAVGGKNGFAELVDYAEEKGFGIYPDFDFVYAQSGGLFDGLSAKKHYVKTIDNRYTSKREYSATYQTFVSYFQMVISPAYYAHFYEKLSDNYLKFNYGNISVGTFGSDLNSDFDEDEPYNREDAKRLTAEALAYLDERYENIMVSGGNAYTWKYADHILNVSLDSSRYNRSSNSVPFLGVMLHGYVQFSGSALNMEGNIGYAMLRTIENGASPYFILSYNAENTTLLKEDQYLNKYYSVRYDIWRPELVEIYTELNGVLADVQDKLIISHEFLVGERVPDEDELEADIIAAQKELANSLAKQEQEAAEQAIKDILTARQTAKTNAAQVQIMLATATDQENIAKEVVATIERILVDLPAAKTAYDAATANEKATSDAYDAAKEVTKQARLAKAAAAEADKAAADEALKKAEAAETEAKNAYYSAQEASKNAKKAYESLDTEYTNALKKGVEANTTAVGAVTKALALAEAARKAADFLATVESATDAIKAAAEEYAVSAETNAQKTVERADGAFDYAAVSIAISANTTVQGLINTATTAANDTKGARANDVKNKFTAVLSAEEAYNAAEAVKAEAQAAYEAAQDAYEKATAAAALDTATQEDKQAATAAGTAMNEAREVFNTAANNSTRQANLLNAAKNTLKNSLQRCLDERKKAENSAGAIEEALVNADKAVKSLATLEGISDTIKAKANESYATAAEIAKGIDEIVNTAKVAYAECAELIKEYIIIEETVEEPEEEPVEEETPAEDENASEDEIPDAETPAEDEDDTGAADVGNQLYADYEYTKYTNDDGNIVKVTYGDTDADGKYVSYKTFILNYNFFDVTVVLDGVTYTIPSSGYVVFYH